MEEETVLVDLTRTGHAHQITLLTLQKLQQEAFMEFEGICWSLEEWPAKKSDCHVQGPDYAIWNPHIDLH